MSLDKSPQQQDFSGISSYATAVFLTAAQVRVRYGCVSEMTIWRWLKDPALVFPEPIRINRRRYWKIADLNDFDKRSEAGDR
jgi:hypothetical protein